MEFFFILLSFLLFQEEIPYKPSDQFQVSIEVKFKSDIQRRNSVPRTLSSDGYQLEMEKNTPASGSYLVVNILNLKIQQNEAKVLAVESTGVTLLKKKTASLTEMHFEMGFIEEIKRNIAAHEIVIYFLSTEKKKVSKIVLSVSKAGVFEVNGEWKGQF